MLAHPREIPLAPQKYGTVRALGAKGDTEVYAFEFDSREAAEQVRPFIALREAAFSSLRDSRNRSHADS